MRKIVNYSSIEHQIEKLKKSNLTIQDEERAYSILSCYGYSNLIKSYREPYAVICTDGIKYRDGVSLEQIFSLYLLDKNLRTAVMAAMLDLEEHIKATSAEVIAASFGTDINEYLKFSNYNNKKKRKERFMLQAIIGDLRKASQSDKDPILHCRTKHGNIPPWILFKGVYFSTITNFIDKFKEPEQIALTQLLYRDRISLPEQSLRMLMMDTLFLCQEYRNLAAHGGRIYNYDSVYKVRLNEIYGDKPLPHLKGIGLLSFVLGQLAYKYPLEIINNSLSEELSRHCSTYPEDVTYLGSVLGMNIIRKNTVYISEKGKLFHTNPYCSGMTHAREIDKDKAIQEQYRPCKRCCN